MAKKKSDTMGFRATEQDKRLVAAALESTNLKVSDLLRECLHKGVLIVVKSVKEVRDEAVRKVEQIVAETIKPVDPVPPSGQATDEQTSAPKSPTDSRAE